jgi:hypothetical protein
MKLLLVLYLLLAVSVWRAAMNLRSADRRLKGALQSAIILLACALVTIFLFSLGWFESGARMAHLAAMVVSVAIGIAIDRSRHRRRTVSRRNEFGGESYLEEWRFGKGKRRREICHLDSSGVLAQIDHWQYYKGKYWIEQRTKYTESGFCHNDYFDGGGRLVVSEDCEINTFRRFNIEYPEGKEAAAFLIDRWERSPLARMFRIEEKE